MENTAKPRSKHLGRQVRLTRELLSFTQEELSKKMDVSQQTISNIESSENLDEGQLKKVAKALGVTADVIKNLDENATLYNIVTNHDNAAFNYNCTFNPLDKLMEVIEKNEKLYEELLKKERETVAMLKKMMEGKG